MCVIHVCVFTGVCNVCVCIYMCVQMPMEAGNWRQLFTTITPFCFLRQGLSLKPEFTRWASLAGHLGLTSGLPPEPWATSVCRSCQLLLAFWMWQLQPHAFMAGALSTEASPSSSVLMASVWQALSWVGGLVCPLPAWGVYTAAWPAEHE